MKTKLICFISVVFLLFTVFSFPAFAINLEDYNLECELPSEYVVITEENAQKNESALKSLGFTISSFQNYLKNNNIILFASLPDKSCQITVNAKSTEFSKQTENFTFLENEQILSLAEAITGNKSNQMQLVESNSSKFVAFTSVGTDKAGNFAVRQFLTVKNSVLFTVNVAFSADTLTAEDVSNANALLKCIDLHQKKTGITANGIQNVAIYVGIVAILLFLVAVIAYIVYTIITDISAAKNTNDVAPYVKIKRRRFR